MEAGRFDLGEGADAGLGEVEAGGGGDGAGGHQGDLGEGLLPEVDEQLLPLGGLVPVADDALLDVPGEVDDADGGAELVAELAADGDLQLILLALGELLAALLGQELLLGLGEGGLEDGPGEAPGVDPDREVDVVVVEHVAVLEVDLGLEGPADAGPADPLLVLAVDGERLEAAQVEALQEFILEVIR